MKFARQFTGELIGTFLMCFLGIGAVAVATLFGALTGPGQVGLVWGLAIAIGIYVTRNLSDAHFNPAVSISMILAGKMKVRDLPAYLLGQCAGAFLAAGSLWVMFGDSVAKNLSNNGLTMSTNSIGSAATIWCEVFPNTANGTVPMMVGAFAEGFGVFILCLVILSLTSDENKGKPSALIAPLFIGLTITVLINVIGPLTDAGLNPARDIMPRLWAACVGWLHLLRQQHHGHHLRVRCRPVRRRHRRCACVPLHLEADAPQKRRGEDRGLSSSFDLRLQHARSPLRSFAYMLT